MFFNNIYNELMMRRKHVTYGENLTITGLIAVHGSGKITIGKNVTINSSPNVNPVAGGNRTHLRAESVRGGVFVLAIV